jgi:hypothetical protein
VARDYKHALDLVGERWGLLIVRDVPRIFAFGLSS